MPLDNISSSQFAIAIKNHSQIGKRRQIGEDARWQGGKSILPKLPVASKGK